MIQQSVRKGLERKKERTSDARSKTKRIPPPMGIRNNPYNLLFSYKNNNIGFIYNLGRFYLHSYYRTQMSHQIYLKWNATVTMNRAPMINQNITFHLPKYNSNMFCVLKVITDRLTLLCLTMYSAIFLQSLLWDLNQMTSHVHIRFPGGLHHKHHGIW